MKLLFDYAQGGPEESDERLQTRKEPVDQVGIHMCMSLHLPESSFESCVSDRLTDSLPSGLLDAREYSKSSYSKLLPGSLQLM